MWISPVQLLLFSRLMFRAMQVYNENEHLNLNCSCLCLLAAIYCIIYHHVDFIQFSAVIFETYIFVIGFLAILSKLTLFHAQPGKNRRFDLLQNLKKI